MPFKMLFIFVEGVDDRRLFERILQPKLRAGYNVIKIIEYAVMSSQEIKRLIRSIRQMNSDYIFVTDLNSASCITARKERMRNAHRDLDDERIAIVKTEIEGWYLAGLDNNACKRLRLRELDATDHLTKEQFNSSIPSAFDSRIDFMVEILNTFSVEIAVGKNKSFNYFVRKYCS